MTIQSSTSRISYTGDGVSAVFTVPFPFFDEEDLSITQTDPATGAPVAVTNATILGAGSPTGGTVTLQAPLTTGFKLNIFLAPEILQLSHYISNAAFPAPTLEEDLDRQVQIDQYLQQQINACIRADVGEVAPVMLLPGVAARKNQALGFDANGNLAVLSSIPAGTLSQSSIGSYLFPQTARELAAGLVPSMPWFGEEIDVRRHGVVGDGSTDDTAALNALGAAAWASDVVLVFQSWMRCKTTDTVSFPSSHTVLDMRGGSRIQYYGPTDRPALSIGSATSAMSGMRMRVAVEYPPLNNDFSNGASLFRGVQFHGSYSGCRIEIPWTRGFTGNVEFYCDSASGVAYNLIELGTSFDSKYHFLVTGVNANGFFNENTVLCGDSQTSSSGGLQTTDSAYGIVLTANPGGYTGHNKNHFIKPCFQLAQAGITAARIPIWLNNAGGSNQFQNCRFEGLNGELVRITSDAVAVRANLIDIGYVAPGAGAVTGFMTETDGGMSYGNRIALNGIPLSMSYYSGNIHARAWISDTTTCKVQGMFFQSSGSGTEQSSGTAKVGKDYVIVHSTTIGTYFDTSACKELRLSSEIQGALGGRIIITAYDSTHAQITRAGAVTFGGVQEDANYGGKRFFQSADGTGTLDFRVDSDVDHIKIMWGNGTNPCNLKSFTVTAYITGLYPTITLSPAAANFGAGLFGGPFGPKLFTSNADPTAKGGPYTERGFFTANEAAASGQKMGWICTLGGWNAPAWVSGTAYKLNEMVNNDTGKIYYCTQAGTSAGSGGPTGTGAGEITDNTAKWRYVGSPTGLNATWTAAPNAP